MKRCFLLFSISLLFWACPPPNTFPDPDSETPTEPLPVSGETQFHYWIHQPLHPGNGQPVRFSVKASDREGISRIELAIFEYELFTNDLGLPSKRRRSGGLWGNIDAWEPLQMDTTVEHTFTFAEGFSAESNVEYIFTITNTAGAISKEMALFDAGDSPWPNDKILLYATQHRSLNETINLCFFPDVDYQGDWSYFLKDVAKMIYQGYHQNNAIGSHKSHWNFYYTRQQTDGQALALDPFNPERYPPFMKDSLIVGIDAFGLLHRQPYSDGAYLNTNIQFLAQNVFTAEGYNLGTAIHETGHAVFHLSDEYNGCVCFSAMDGSNVFSSAAACEQFTDSLGFGTEPCTEIIAYDGQSWFLPEKPPFFSTEEACREYNIQNGLPADSCRIFQDITGQRSYQAFKGACIMENDGDAEVPDFRHICASVIDRYYQLLQPIETLPVEGVLAEAVDNFFGYEPVILLDVNLEGTEMEVAIQKIAYGIPTKNLIRPGDINLRLAAYRLSLNRPDCVHIHHGKNLADVQTTIRPSSCSVAVPLIRELGNIRCQDNRYGLSEEEQLFNIKKELIEELIDFQKE